MSGYLLDTVTLSEGWQRSANPGLASWLSDTDEGDMYVSVLTIGEIQKGIDRLEEGSKRRSELERRLVFGLLGKLAGRILSFDIHTARLWGSLTAGALNVGRAVPTVDSQLAATALHHSMTIVTRNEKDFKSLGVATLNPWS